MSKDSQKRKVPAQYSSIGSVIRLHICLKSWCQSCFIASKHINRTTTSCLYLGTIETINSDVYTLTITQPGRLPCQPLYFTMVCLVRVNYISKIQAYTQIYVFWMLNYWLKTDFISLFNASPQSINLCIMGHQVEKTAALGRNKYWYILQET